jgi:hypothetical protein
MNKIGGFRIIATRWKARQQPPASPNYA